MVENNKQFERIQQNIIVPNTLAGKRLDQILATLLPEYSREMLKRWLLEGYILVNGKVEKPKTKLYGTEEISINVKLNQHQEHIQAQEMNLDITYEDEHILIINKPVGLIVHPGAGNPDNTLLNALIAHDEKLNLIPRCGIVHRLDKDTSGLLVCAKTLKAHTSLVEQLQQRSVKRQYEAVACGHIISGQTIDANIARHPHNRLKMAVVNEGGKSAITHINVIEHFRDYTRIRCQLETGRTHQIRVHLQHIKHPLVGDLTYNPRLRITKGTSEALATFLHQFKRQALHAYHLSFIHPDTKETVSFTQNMPKDMKELIRLLREDMDQLKADYYEDDYDFNDDYCEDTE
ncbi:23S rRNA pseudouridine(1911/1915/1917) synthase RluD [Thiotrichales bacterium 19S11-10]|nr:23S rRNA pseudouridine(1911/1915/1917) synthase RluD [Thiotrichales bacterium 19S11-10]